MCQIQNIQENLENADFYHNKDSFWTYMVHNQLLSSIWHLYLYCVTKKWWCEKFWWGLFVHGVELFLIYNQALSKSGQFVEEKPEQMVQNGYDFQIQHPKIS